MHECLRMLAGIRVLIVDDDQDTLAMLAAVLEHHGARIVTATSVAAAMEALSNPSSFDVIISDLMMPGTDGYQFVKMVRAREDITPAIALSGRTGPAERSRALLIGFQRHLSKPVSGAQLVRAIREVLPPELTSAGVK